MISRLELFFPVVIMIAHPPDRRLELFFPVVILPLLSIETLAHLLHVGWRNLPTLRVGWRNFFSSCAVVTVLVMAGNWFWYLCTQGIVPYSCGFVLVFLFLAGNSFWCYVRTQCSIQLCCCVSFSVMAGNVITTGKNKFKSSVWRVRDRNNDRKKKVLVVIFTQN